MGISSYFKVIEGQGVCTYEHKTKLGNLGKKLKPNTTSFAFKSVSLTGTGYNVGDEQVNAVCIVRSLHMRCGYFGISVTQCKEFLQVQLRLLYICYCAICITQSFTGTQLECIMLTIQDEFP